MVKTLLCLLALSPAASARAAGHPPHLVFLMADDLGWSNVGYHNAHARTPHIDGLVREGVELDRHCKCTSSRCSSSIASAPGHSVALFVQMSTTTAGRPGHRF